MIPILIVGELHVALNRNSVRCGEMPVELSDDEYALVQYMCYRPLGQPVTFQELLQGMGVTTPKVREAVRGALCKLKRYLKTTTAGFVLKEPDAP